MGQDKLPLMVGEKSLLDRVHLALASRCEEILFVGGGGYVPAGARRVPDLRPGRQGPLAGIEAGLLAARHRPVFVAAGDMPFLTGDFVKYLLGLLSGGVPAVVPRFGEMLHPLCAAYGRENRPAVSAALDRGARSVRELLEGLADVRYVREEELRRFGDSGILLLNVNSPEDLERARKALRGGEG
ncbi:MAG: Molybdopterin-guanine dinucleotide biosynthesis protein MobA [uncultured Rubrobacteraceae bacterium]|uniref:Molybdopterin-guanine dinucleotide biosynthesis protein MobA n=1 Tax=uncultured Rubrobacteraceae bacterium TaxID=349277 RepID=A0A6J4QJY3_9ACTN|nr:MAG: Molybdopterin-guanine dinucleotide biosynthesis protein MobA [uncultured Rubrobacteraceae bacterium]